MGLLQKMRSKSDKQKNLLAIIFAALITLVIVILWFSFNLSSEPDTPKPESKLSEIAPFQTLKEQFSQITTDFKNNFSKVNKEINAIKVEDENQDNINNN